MSSSPSKLPSMLLLMASMGMLNEAGKMLRKPLGTPPNSKPYEPEQQSKESKQYYLKRAEEKRKRKGWVK